MVAFSRYFSDKRTKANGSSITHIVNRCFQLVKHVNRMVVINELSSLELIVKKPVISDMPI
jgi:hypothetical protein